MTLWSMADFGIIRKEKTENKKMAVRFNSVYYCDDELLLVGTGKTKSMFCPSIAGHCQALPAIAVFTCNYLVTWFCAQLNSSLVLQPPSFAFFAGCRSLHSRLLVVCLWVVISVASRCWLV